MRYPQRTGEFRSGLEETLAKQMTLAGVPFEYEPKDGKVSYKRPERESKYNPDFVLPNGMIIEAKGRFTQPDRAKFLLIKTQHPELDIRFVFSNSRSKISKDSKTTYADWCKKHRFPYADRNIPQEWLNEPWFKGDGGTPALRARTARRIRIRALPLFKQRAYRWVGPRSAARRSNAALPD